MRAAPVRVAKSRVRSGECSPARVRMSARISRPSASVLPISMVRPLRLDRMSPGPEGVAGDGVLDGGDQHDQPDRQSRLHDQPAERQGVGRTAHVLLHIAHAGGGLDVQSAGIEHHALADQGDQRQIGAVQIPADLDDPGRAMRCGGAADGVHRRIVFIQQGVAVTTVMVAPASCAISRAMVSICSGPISAAGVSTISRARAQAEAIRRGRRQIEAVGRDQPHPVAVGTGLVAVEDIGPEQEGQGGLARVVGFRLEPVEARRQLGRAGRGRTSDRRSRRPRPEPRRSRRRRPGRPEPGRACP